jgi:hypothetical protein
MALTKLNSASVIERLPVGSIIQTKNFQTGVLDTGSALIPFDDTIPQITEGDEYMTLAFTPTSATNKLHIDVRLNINTTAENALVVALFEGTTANALACFVNREDAYKNKNVSFSHHMLASSTSELTFRVRAGANASNTTSFNGYGTGGKYGGSLASSITIMEIKQ